MQQFNSLELSISDAEFRGICAYMAYTQFIRVPIQAKWVNYRRFLQPYTLQCNYQALAGSLTSGTD